MTAPRQYTEEELLNILVGNSPPKKINYNLIITKIKQFLRYSVLSLKRVVWYPDTEDYNPTYMSSDDIFMSDKLRYIMRWIFVMQTVVFPLLIYYMHRSKKIIN